MGGELHPLKYGSFHKDTNRLFAVIDAEEEFVLNSPGQHNRRIWIDLYETRLSNDVIAKLVSHLITISPKIFKLCLVGCSFLSKHKIIRQMKKQGLEIAPQVRFYSDPEVAKQWLVR
jgi:hypothetical protein